MRLAAHLPVLAVIVPLFGAFFTALAGRKGKTLGWPIAVLTTGVSFAICLSLLMKVLQEGRISYWLGNWEPPWGIEYVVDVLSGFVLVVVSLMAFAVSIYARRSVEQEIPQAKIGTFYALYLLLVTGLLGIVATGDIFNLYVFLEISALSGYALIAAANKREALMASFNYLVLGTISATFILLGIGYLYMVTGSLNMADLSKRLPELYHNKVVLTAFAFFTVGLSIKLALFPFHVWLPNAYTHAPSVVTAFMAATSTKVGAYALLRIMFTVFTPDFDTRIVPLSDLLVWLAAAAMIAGPVLAIAQTDIRRMLAYSSIGQIGYIVLGIALANHPAMVGGLTHLFNHALMKGGLFLVVGSLAYKTGTTRIADLKGMGQKMPFTMAAFTVGALSMIGVPLTVGFVSKWYLAIGALEAGRGILLAVILLSSLLTAIYFWRILEFAYFKAAPQSQGSARREDAPAGMLIPALALAALCILFGVLAFIPVSITQLGADLLLGPE